MNLEHLRAFLWLRWRLRANQLKRGGSANVIILGILVVGGVLLALSMFVGMLLTGLLAMGHVSPTVMMLIWDGLVVAFLFSWSIGLLTDLQRSEGVSLEKFLHLPVSLEGAFVINYLSSLLSLTLVIFLPAFVGLILGTVIARGPGQLLIALPLFGFLWAVTALTYQFQGWLASLMSNPRRRRTVIVLTTAIFVVICQIPNIINIRQPWKPNANELEQSVQVAQKIGELSQELAAQKITFDQYNQQKLEIEAEAKKVRDAEDQALLAKAENIANTLNLILPPGWLPLSVRSEAEGAYYVPLLATLGYSVVGAYSLRRAFKTTMRLYRGEFLAGAAPQVEPTERPATPRIVLGEAPTLLERSLPGVSEHAAAIALATFRGLIRAPEVKMMMLTPVILLLVLGSMVAAGHVEKLPEMGRPLLAFGAMSTVLLTMVGMIGNQFGFDRSGFRVFILCPAKREEILLGKNLGFAPLALSVGSVMLLALQIFAPMRIDHFLAAIPQMGLMFLLFLIGANLLSILAPMPIPAGSMKPANPKLLPVLLHVGFVLVFPPLLAPALAPLGVEYVLKSAGWVEGFPVCLLLTLVLCAAVIPLYRLVVSWQGHLFHLRELAILDVVTSKSD